jgi:hypothetical protein
MKLKITQVEALLSTRLRITWENGKHTEVDAGDYFYSTGAKPIPAYIGLACKGWEAGHRTHAA